MAFIIVYLIIPPLRGLAVRIGFVDRPTERKIHKEPVPHLAGVGIFAGFISVYLAFVREWDGETLGILVGSLMILSIGIVDDWYKTHGKEFPALPKLIVQVGAAAVVYFSGIVFTGFNNPFTGQYILLPVWIQFVLTVTWIFGVTTVINFSDGIDGLAGGLSAISSATLFIVALVMGRTAPAYMAIILVGAALGYLRYNSPPARVYMGDAGATFMGFILGIIALDGAFKQATVLSVLIPILALGVPIFDNVFVVFKRMKEGKPIYKADRSQAHYRLLSAGLNPKQALAFLCLISLCFSLTSIIILLLRA
ncbi:UDP-N-acetylmuramyl pentapeptide phosphotransferase/UDP-N-acetylglucosamine-1-phosphate transferase [Anaerobacterium chartisolvens]|uniref:UDP-N-acetylmuramyl pentapeptide phosphotransferase/UDP-N-acetylglucosamine-1-phosphate transferase n=1 Tax=Anaerobacterium chartisolvens TaxID=1297424 RepID=A0A369BBH9_9FIRM|nr:MraY family glycosyltransferase [Anaerobacterium chartisolvens]RCX17958.1 UDP-N-acetylmuramyl pentapeptide phosphotransferase/UDP-N-acetylglucosamine-1-phosphate transferase [Anaerobacterium chartisolvens]